MKVFTAVAILCGVFVFLGNSAAILARFMPTFTEYREPLGDNEEYTPCLAFECNQPTCANDREMILPCPLMCVPGYICQKGYARDYPNRHCIPRSSCPQRLTHDKV